MRFLLRALRLFGLWLSLIGMAGFGLCGVIGLSSAASENDMRWVGPILGVLGLLIAYVMWRASRELSAALKESEK